MEKHSWRVSLSPVWISVGVYLVWLMSEVLVHMHPIRSRYYCLSRIEYIVVSQGHASKLDSVQS